VAVETVYPDNVVIGHAGFVRSDPSVWLRDQSTRLSIAACVLTVAGLTVMRGVFAAINPLRVDEAYYWTWSHESVISYLDHPPMIAWCVHLGTLIFGDTNFGVRFSGLLAMLVMQVLLADIVWRTARDWRCVLLAVLLPEAALDYGLLMTKTVPDTALIAFSVAMVWALVRLALSHDLRWWLLAGAFGGCALLSKYIAILLLPAIIAYALLPPWRKTQLSSPYPWCAALLALAIFSPVLYWNAIHDWESFRFQINRPTQTQGVSWKFLAEFVGTQFLLVGPMLFPVVLIGTVRLGWRGIRLKDPITVLLTMCVAFPLGFFLTRSLYGRIGDSWPLFVWPFGFACAAINLKFWRQDAPASSLAQIAPAAAVMTILTGIGLVVPATIYYTAGSANYLATNDPIGKEAGFAEVIEAASRERDKTGATWFATTDYRIYSMLRWHLKDRFPVVQVNERNRYIGFDNRDADMGPIGLYVSQQDETWNDMWSTTTARLDPIGVVDLSWRGVRYDTYLMQKLTKWKPVLSPPSGDPLFVSRPH
jgi:4-amino-4-deoxy-L-arabinose transferase-like glycosyltransferase